MDTGHFDVILIDEAGQALEPEAVAPVATLLGPNGQLVLAGDPHQLGPVIHHTLAKEHGLETSLIERLMARPLYGRSPVVGEAGAQRYDVRVLTKLLRNFRSHPALLELPNQLFYDGELLPSADLGLVSRCLRWDALPTEGVPLIFHGIEGKDEREGNSPSWYLRRTCSHPVVPMSHSASLCPSAPLPLCSAIQSCTPPPSSLMWRYAPTCPRVQRKVQCRRGSTGPKVCKGTRYHATQPAEAGGDRGHLAV